jgi:catechol 2,3-dioxygenase-like lactoylglutathione lyase family enzyme
MTRVHHVKIPVTDLQRSVTWYCDLMDLLLWREFIENDELRGAALKSEEGKFSFGLRLREHCASTPDLTGFDVVSLQMATREALELLRNRCADLGATHTEIQDRRANEAVLDVTDPDGTVLRFYWEAPTDQPDVFSGVVFRGDGPPELVSEPRLAAPRVDGRPPHGGSEVALPS